MLKRKQTYKYKKWRSFGIYLIIVIILVSFVSGCIKTNNKNNESNSNIQSVLSEYDQWAVQNFGSLSNPDARRSLDPDHDYVDNLFEYQNGTNPTKAYTYEGLDDFNLIYTYPHCFTNISDRNLTQKEINEFLVKIPDVEPRYWTNKDGSVAHTYVDGKYINVSLKDPLVQYYAKKVAIEWKDDKDFGKFGELKLGNEPLFLEYGTFDANKSGVPPSYYLTHGRKGNCAEVAIAHMAVLILKGYNSTQCGCYIKNDGKKYGHGFAETFIDGKVYAVNFNQLWPREGKNGESIYERWNWILKENYDRNWVENKNYNYM